VKKEAAHSWRRAAELVGNRKELAGLREPATHDGQCFEGQDVIARLGDESGLGQEAIGQILELRNGKTEALDCRRVIELGVECVEEVDARGRTPDTEQHVGVEVAQNTKDAAQVTFSGSVQAADEIGSLCRVQRRRNEGHGRQWKAAAYPMARTVNPPDARNTRFARLNSR